MTLDLESGYGFFISEKLLNNILYNKIHTQSTRFYKISNKIFIKFDFNLGVHQTRIHFQDVLIILNHAVSDALYTYIHIYK